MIHFCIDTSHSQSFFKCNWRMYLQTQLGVVFEIREAVWKHFLSHCFLTMSSTRTTVFIYTSSSFAVIMIVYSLNVYWLSCQLISRMENDWNVWIPWLVVNVNSIDSLRLFITSNCTSGCVNCTIAHSKIIKRHKLGHHYGVNDSLCEISANRSSVSEKWF